MISAAPKNLYHYTSFAVLLSIVEKRELWFTDFRFLNDSEEFHFARSVVKNSLANYDFTRKAEMFRDLVKGETLHMQSFDSLVKNLKARLISTHFDADNIYARYTLSAYYRPYIFSLSDDGDSLSQWRAYGNGEVCIEFDVPKLMELGLGQISKVEYKHRTETDIRVDRGLDKFFDDVYKQFAACGRIDRETIEDGSQDLGPTFRDVFKPINIKHAGFQDEREWRLVLEVSPRTEKSGATFITAGRYLTPRVKVSILNKATSTLDVISAVVFGPGTDKQLASQSIAALNEAMSTKISCRFSDIPYRV